MAKQKISSNDFLKFLTEETNAEDIAFRPSNLSNQKSVSTNDDKSVKSNHEPKLSQSEDKVESGLVTKKQTDVHIDKSVKSNHEPKLGQSEVEVESNISQAGVYHEANLSQSEVKVRTKLDTKLESMLSHVSSLNKEFSIDTLIGLQKEILVFIFEKCKFLGTKISPPLRVEVISESVNSTISSTRKAIQRLEYKNFLKRHEFKDGRGGWTKYLLPDGVYQCLIQSENDYKVEPKLSQSEVKVRTKLESKVEPTDSSIVQYKDLNKYNTVQELQNAEVSKNPNQVDDFWEELKEVDFSELEKFKINAGVVSQLKKNNWRITRTNLEDFIERFVRYFTEKEFEKRRSTIKSPQAFFLASIRDISKGEDDPIGDIKTSYELAKEVSRQNKLKEFERIQKEEQVLEQKLEALKETHFERWFSTLSDSQKTELAPPNNFADLGTSTHKLILKSVFSETLWLNIKHNLLNSPRLDDKNSIQHDLL